MGRKGSYRRGISALFFILEAIGEVGYRFALPPQLSSIHPMFHVSMLQKYIRHPSHVINFDDLHIEEDVSYVVKSVRILDSKEQTLRRKKIWLVKVE